jgi:hypothetical protein
MSTKRDDDWIDLKDFADATVFVDAPPSADRTKLRWKLRDEASPSDLTFRIEIKNDRETK